MTRENFSNGFDTLLNSYANAAQFGDAHAKADIALDEYEKSLFLTQAQEEEVLSLYNGKNIDRESFEATEELRRYLAPLIEEAELHPIETTNGKPLGVDSNSKFFTLPEGLWFITYEAAIITDGKCEGTTTLDVYPVRQDEYHKIKKNPFRGANDRRALRLDLSEGNVEIISKYGVTSYYVRYLRKLSPIVLIDFGSEISVNGKSEATDCELPDILHQRILERAVMLALKAKGIRSENNNENR
jgi:hypothetical protein